ncbi:MAG: hypothetical protein N3F63_04940 [Thermoplasmata archaeon]|nr:hypothetical protein [Thermoplasmata archaeon]
MAGVKLSNVVWAAVAGIGLLIIILLFVWIWLVYTPMWACLISGILSLFLGIVAYFGQSSIEKPLFGQVSALVFGMAGVGFLLGAAWMQADALKIPCLIAVLIVAFVVFGFGAWKIKDMEREREIKATRKKL